jgi:RNA polymerase sigma-70 factor (ECF subfamily)
VTVAVADLVTLTDPQDAQIAEGRESPHIQALVEAARRGDREAFGDLVALHERIVLRTTLAALRSREDAEDAAQDAFVVAWQKLGGFRGEATFKTWLLTIAWRKALDRRRQRQTWWTRVRASASRPDVNEVDPIESLPGGGADPERIAISIDLARHVRTAISRLSPKLRDTLLLAATGEHTYEEIAAILRVPVGTVKWRVAEARRLVNDQVPAARIEP